MEELFFKVYRNIYLKRKIHSYIKRIIKNNKYTLFTMVCYNYFNYTIMYNSILTKKDIIYLLCRDYIGKIIIECKNVALLYNSNCISDYDIFEKLYEQQNISQAATSHYIKDCKSLKYKNIMLEKFKVDNEENLYNEIFINRKTFIIKCFKIIYNIKLISGHYVSSNYSQSNEKCICHNNYIYTGFKFFNNQNIDLNKNTYHILYLSIINLIENILYNIRKDKVEIQSYIKKFERFNNCTTDKKEIYEYKYKAYHIEMKNGTYRYSCKIVNAILSKNLNIKKLYSLILNKHNKMMNSTGFHGSNINIDILLHDFIDNISIANYICDIIITETNNIFNKKASINDTRNLLKKSINITSDNKVNLVMLKYAMDFINPLSHF